MVYEYFKVSDTDESFLDLNALLKDEWKHDYVQSFNTCWDETIITTKKQPDDEIQDNFNFRQLQQSTLLKPILLSLYIQDTVQKDESRDYTRLTIQRRDENPKKKERVLAPALQERFPLEEESRQGNSPSGKENQPKCFAYEMGDCPTRNVCDYWYPHECPFHQQVSCKLGR